MHVRPHTRLLLILLYLVVVASVVMPIAFWLQWVSWSPYFLIKPFFDAWLDQPVTGFPLLLTGSFGWFGAGVFATMIIDLGFLRRHHWA